MADKNRIEPQPPVSKVFEDVPLNRTVETSPYIMLNVNGRDIGLVQEVSPTQNRALTWVYEISNLQPVEAVPGKYSSALSIKRVMTYYSELMDVLGYMKVLSDVGLNPEDPTAIYNLAYAVAPMDIMLKFKIPSDMNIQVSGQSTLTDNRVITKTFREAWITKMAYTVSVTNEQIIIETMDMQFRDIIQNALRPASNNTEYTTGGSISA